jgi:phospholipid/cholesterol/gamma-HCH transport system substrate-binding protein
VNALFDRLKEVTSQTQVTLDTFQRVGIQTESLLNNEVQSFISSARDATQTLERSTSRVDRLLVRNEDALNRGIQGVGELAPALRDMRTTLNNLNGLINRMEEDPAGLLLGKERLQEFNP